MQHCHNVFKGGAMQQAMHSVTGFPQRNMYTQKIKHKYISLDLTWQDIIVLIYCGHCRHTHIIIVRTAISCSTTILLY